MFDNFTTWTAHAEYVFKKVETTVGILGCIRSFMTEEAAILVYNTIIVPLFDYWDVFWSSLQQQDMDHEQPVRIITGCACSSEAIHCKVFAMADIFLADAPTPRVTLSVFSVLIH